MRSLLRDSPTRNFALTMHSRDVSQPQTMKRSNSRSNVSSLTDYSPITKHERRNSATTKHLPSPRSSRKNSSTENRDPPKTEASGSTSTLNRSSSMNKGNEVESKATRKESVGKAPSSSGGSVSRSSSFNRNSVDRNSTTMEEEKAKLREDHSNIRHRQLPPHSKVTSFQGHRSRRNSFSDFTSTEFAKMALQNDKANLHSSQENIFPNSTSNDTGSHGIRKANSTNSIPLLLSGKQGADGRKKTRFDKITSNFSFASCFGGPKSLERKDFKVKKHDSKLQTGSRSRPMLATYNLTAPYATSKY